MRKEIADSAETLTRIPSAEEISIALRQNWRQLWRRISMGGSDKGACESFIAKYSQAGRHHHGLPHLYEGLIVDLPHASVLPVDLDPIAVAFWGHDSVYDVRASESENEYASADLMDRLLKSACLSESFRRDVYRLIIATSHKTKPRFMDEKIITDIDLAILGKPQEMYDRYESGIRLEYQHVDEAIFRRKRAKILSTFLERKPLYSTQIFQDLYESQAKQNLQRAISALSS